MVTREHGKTLADSRSEVQRGLEMIEFACGIPGLLVGTSLPNIATDGRCGDGPASGGSVVLGLHRITFRIWFRYGCFPFAMFLREHIFILKTSEKVPLSSIRLGELLTEAVYLQVS